MTIYDKIGSSYDSTRKADPYIADKILEFLSPNPNGLYLDIGCGTGNYLKVFTERGHNVIGMDPSEIMIQQAKAKNPHTIFHQAKAESIPVQDNYFDGATAILTIHHWDDILTGLKEINRVMKPGGRLVLFSFTPEQMQGYWLCNYFPKMIEKCMCQIPGLETMEQMFHSAGFSSFKTEPYFVKPNLADHFLYSNKHSPEKYLSAEIRDNASGFRIFSDPWEMKQGLTALEEDIQSGEITSVIKKYENSLGDYLFLVVIKLFF